MGSAAGGGTDGTTRLVGMYLEKYLPGNPTMRYRNVPGGHGTKGLNYFAKAKPDGLTWAGGSSSHTDPAALRKKASSNTIPPSSVSLAACRAAAPLSSSARRSCRT